MAAFMELNFSNMYYLVAILLSIGCLFLPFLAKNALFMNTSLESTDISMTDTHGRRYRSCDISLRLLYQLNHNNDNPTHNKTYRDFPSGDLGHLTTFQQIRLVEILKNSQLADQYKYACVPGKMYKKGSYKYPTATPEMIGTVLAVELS